VLLCTLYVNILHRYAYVTLVDETKFV